MRTGQRISLLLLGTLGCTPNWAPHREDAGPESDIPAESSTTGDSGEGNDVLEAAPADDDSAKETERDAEAASAGDSGLTLMPDATLPDGSAGAEPRSECPVGSCGGDTCAGSDPEVGAPCARGADRVGVCDDTGACVECNRDSDCAGTVGDVGTCHEPVCSNHECSTRVKEWATCGSKQVCNHAGACASACGNGHFDAELEECDPTAGWDTWSCNKNTCRHTGLSAATSYHPCSGPSDCASGETCKATPISIGLVICIPTCSAPPAQSCPIPPGYTPAIIGDQPLCDNYGHDCLVRCLKNYDCPPGDVCSEGVCYAAR